MYMTSETIALLQEEIKSKVVVITGAEINVTGGFELGNGLRLTTEELKSYRSFDVDRPGK